MLKRACISALISGLLCVCTADIAKAQSQEAAGALDAPTHSSSSEIGFRFGVGMLGGSSLSVADTGMGGMYLQLGVEVTSWLAIYAQSEALLGATLSDDYGRVLVQSFNHAFVELTAFGALSVAAGPSVDYTSRCEVNGQELTAGCHEGVDLGYHLRIGLHAGALLGAMDIHRTGGDVDETFLLGAVGVQL